MLSEELAVLKTALYCKGTEMCHGQRGHCHRVVASFCPPWGCFKVGVILGVECMEVGLMCPLLCTGSSFHEILLSNGCDGEGGQGSWKGLVSGEQTFGSLLNWGSRGKNIAFRKRSSK